MISGRSSDTTYEATLNRNPGKTSSVTAAPPTRCRRSRTRASRPARARYAAAVRPLWPPPTMTASYRFGTARTSRRPGRRSTFDASARGPEGAMLGFLER